MSVPAARTYSEPARPFPPRRIARASLTAQQISDDLLDADDVLGKRIIPTRLRGNVTIREENAAAALEVMSRFAVDPKWLIYLPPTMSPCETSRAAGLLEHPAEVFAYYRGQDATPVICQEKHMGSRAVVIICRDEQVARTRFGVDAGAIGMVVDSHRPAVLHRSRHSSEHFWSGSAWRCDRSGLWSKLETHVGMPRLRALAVVGQGTRALARSVCAGRRRRPGRPAQGGGGAEPGRSARFENADKDSDAGRRRVVSSA